jgi:TonB family protein
LLSRSYLLGTLLSGTVHAVPLIILSLTGEQDLLPIQVVPISLEFVAPPEETPKATETKPQTTKSKSETQLPKTTETEPLSLMTAQDVISHNPKPLYPEEARLLGIQGIVTVELIIERGVLISARIENSPHDLLSHAALTQLKKWSFPKTCRKTTILVPIDFELI